jgi:hypothetical protein
MHGSKGAIKCPPNKHRRNKQLRFICGIDLSDQTGSG